MPVAVEADLEEHDLAGSEGVHGLREKTTVRSKYTTS